MQPAGFRANFFRYRRGKGNHVMSYFGFNFVDALQVKIAAFGYRPGGILRDNPRICQCKAGCSFNLEPAAKFIFITPDSAHLRARITLNQRFFLEITAV